MEFGDVVRARRMVRRFDDTRAVPEQVLLGILQNATRAPSAGFSQGWDFVVLSTPAEREVFWSATVDPTAPADAWLRGVRTAPTLIVCCSDPQRYRRRYAEPDKATGPPRAWPIPYWDVDTGMAALLMLLTAVDHDLGGLFFGVPAEAMDAVRAALEIPPDRRLVGVVALGYPRPRSGPPRRHRSRRSMAQVAHAGRFGRPWGRRVSSPG